MYKKNNNNNLIKLKMSLRCSGRKKNVLNTIATNNYYRLNDVFIVPKLRITIENLNRNFIITYVIVNIIERNTRYNGQSSMKTFSYEKEFPTKHKPRYE